MHSVRTILTASAATGLAALLTACGSSTATSSPAAPRSAASLDPASGGPTTAGSPSTVPATPPAASSTAQEVSPTGDIPDSQVFVAYRSTAGFTMRVPEGWARTRVGTLTVFTDKLNSVAVQTLALGSAPTVASVTSSELPSVRSAVHGYAAGSVSAVSRTAGSVVRATYQIDSAANPVTGKSVRDAVERYSYWKAGREVVLTLTGPTGADNVDPWRTITDSFRWTR